MRNTFCHIALLVVSALIMAGCASRHPSGIEGVKWEPVDSFSDSLTLRIERSFYEAVGARSIKSDIDGLLNHASALGSSAVSNEVKARGLFFAARLAERELSDSLAKIYIKSSAAQCDSVAYPYTFRRIDMLRSELNSDTSDGDLNRQFVNLDYFTSVGDRPMQASVCILIGNILLNSSLSEQALGYFREADRICGESGLRIWKSKNQINISACLFKTGCTQEGERMLRSLLDNPDIKDDFMTYNMVLRNSYLHFNDVGYLKQAYARSVGGDPASPLNAVYEIMLGRHYLESSTSADTATADVYGRKSFSRLADVRDIEVRKEILIDALSRFRREGKKDSAYICQSMYIDTRMDEDLKVRPEKVAYMQNVKELNRLEAERSETRLYYTVGLFVMLLAVVIVTAVAFNLDRRRRQQHKIDEERHINENIRQQLEIERFQRQFLAMEIANQDSDRRLGMLQESLDNLRNQETISRSDIGKLEKAIKSNSSRQDEWNSFRELINKTEPTFHRKLKAAYPDLSESQLRFATFINIGMDNKQIAAFLNIRAESVKQSRWRLRNKMKLAPEVSLEDALRSL